MAQISYISTTPKPYSPNSLTIPNDESIGLMLFDTDGFEDVFKNYPLLYSNFKDGQVCCINNMDEASILGITDDGFMNGVVYHHLSQFYKFLGASQSVYIAIVDCSDNWDVIQQIQQEVSGKIFHVGIWTSKYIWESNADGSIGFTGLITDLQRQADEINGKIGEATHSMVPLHIVLFANSSTASGTPISYKDLPDATVLECPKVSVVLVENGSDEIHRFQKSSPRNAPMGSLGLVMGCLVVCGAEESIASVEKCDLNKDEEFNYPEWPIGESGISISEIHRLWVNQISSRGYIIPIDYEGLEASYFLSSDQTLSNGDFNTIANNRVMHKCRRVICSVMIPYINANHIYDPATKNISISSQSTIKNSIDEAFRSIMTNSKGLPQIDGHNITFL